MKNSMTFEEQTEQIVEALFTSLCAKKVESQVADRCLELKPKRKNTFEVDSENSFDPVDIAKKLRYLGDQYNAELEGPAQAIITEESKAKLKKFRELTESLSRTWSSHTPGLEYERAFLAVAVKLFEYFIRKTAGYPGQINLLTDTINTNAEVRGYIDRQGGWSNLGRGLNNP
ncbi:bcl-2-like protein 15 [Candoia aspera]|uniref:bcl-2-like protein 15 n=1 Tax=Candoia aspera TaxID=51853 RepID=UPI002FD7A123